MQEKYARQNDNFLKSEKVVKSAVNEEKRVSKDPLTISASWSVLKSSTYLQFLQKQSLFQEPNSPTFHRQRSLSSPTPTVVYRANFQEREKGHLVHRANIFGPKNNNNFINLQQISDKFPNNHVCDNVKHISHFFNYNSTKLSYLVNKNDM
jgi:hypothetical protein